MLQRQDSDWIFIISDVHHASTDRLNEFARKSAIGGMDIYPFELTYPNTDEFSPSSTVKLLGGGYKHFSRGKIAGFMIP